MAASQQTTSRPSANDGEPVAKRQKLSFKEIAESPTFQVIVGPAKHVFTIHSSLLADQSPVLHALVNNGMKESKDRSVIWPEVSEHTFSQFFAFAYTGTFQIEDPPQTRNKEFLPRLTPAGWSLAKIGQYARWLARHVDLCVFAEYYGIEKLLSATTSKLESILRRLSPGYPLSDCPVSAIGRLFEACFSKATPEPLRSIVRPFIEKHGAELWQDPAFKGIVRQSGSLTSEFIDCLVRGRRNVKA